MCVHAHICVYVFLCVCMCVCVCPYFWSIHTAYTLSEHKNLQGLTCNGTPIALLADGMSQLEGFVIVRVSMERHRAHNYGHSITCSLQGSGGLVHKDLKCTQVQVQVFLTG